MRPEPSRAMDDGSGTVGTPPLVPIGPVVLRVGLYTSTPKTKPFALAPKLAAVRPVAETVNDRGLACAPPAPCAVFNVTAYAKFPNPSKWFEPAVPLRREKFVFEKPVALTPELIPVRLKSMVS